MVPWFGASERARCARSFVLCRVVRVGRMIVDWSSRSPDDFLGGPDDLRSSRYHPGVILFVLGCVPAAIRGEQKAPGTFFSKSQAKYCASYFSLATVKMCVPSAIIPVSSRFAHVYGFFFVWGGAPDKHPKGTKALANTEILPESPGCHYRDINHKGDMIMFIPHSPACWFCRKGLFFKLTAPENTSRILRLALPAWGCFLFNLHSPGSSGRTKG